MSSARAGSAAARPSTAGMLSYAMPMVACYFLLGPTYSVLPAIYAKYFGLELTTIALVVLCARMLDVLSDPLIGCLSDRHRRRGGTRKVWVAAGGAGLVVAAQLLFAPPADPSPGYYFGWSVTFFVAYSMIEISHVTWGGELTRNYGARSAVYSYRSAAIFSGFILWAGFPMLPFAPDREFTPEVLRRIAYAGAVLALVTVAWAAAWAPNGTPIIAGRPDSWRDMARSITGNGPLRLVMTAYLLCALGVGMWQGLVFLYLDCRLGLGAKFAVVQLLANIAALGAIPVWRRLAQRFDKSSVWITSMVLFIIFNSGFLLLGLQSPWWHALLPVAGIHACFSCLYIVVPSIVGDVVDYGELKFGENRGATYFSLNNLLSKTGIGVGGAAALAIAGHYGVDVSQTAQSTRAIRGLQLAYVILPSVLVLASSIFIWLIPIDRRRHDIVRRRIESRARRVARLNPVQQ